ncbi:MAG: hypothetical protein A2Y07_00225 [Planctomycetes bacterium GWF2_50_10]|nr:MAG: hypothetical protein A2Y07_00225 [Planctomycetes bacterium GWF2_50_10]
MLIRRRQLLLGKASKKGGIIAWRNIRTNMYNLPVPLQLGGPLVAHHDYYGYFMASGVLALVATAVSATLTRHEKTP